MRRQVTTEESVKAALILCDMAAERPECFEGAMPEIGWMRKPETLLHNQRQRRLGRWLVRRYRQDTNVQGVIDWEKFRIWMNEHIGEITFARLLVSMITLLIML